MKKNVMLLLILCFILALSGCKSSKPVNNEENKKEDAIEKPKLPEEEEEEPIIEKEGVPSPLSGIYAPEEIVNRRPVAVMFDNHKGARWQAGLNQAEIIYEFLAEGKITRYMGLYLINDPDLIGPIRSARPYFITASLEYDAVYVHDGGSPQAKLDVKRLGIPDISAQSTGKYVFWRSAGKSNKRPPHNEYSSVKRVRETQEQRGYKPTGDYQPFKFNEDFKKIDGEEAKVININYFSNNKTKYVYDEENKEYKRYKDGKLHIDETDETPITAKNIIIQRAKTRIIDSEGRLSISLVGQGKGIYITGGKSIPVKWKKDSRRSKTLFYDELGEEIVLNPGVTWIQVVKTDTDINIEQGD
ncbi:DUF3048 domain-containing protein [Clostridiisalibacter paucivorans]|uniref:DUF3048 domain-containing protein n=1 Tax=Clostridiisalibacter paucivorans TaxID=408753 RepID=UPI00047C03D4|nr:DUF3048 domain-containing protein [Clostridiisalibacter paucivorans]